MPFNQCYRHVHAAWAIIILLRDVQDIHLSTLTALSQRSSVLHCMLTQMCLCVCVCVCVILHGEGAGHAPEAYDAQLSMKLRRIEEE